MKNLTTPREAFQVQTEIRLFCSLGTSASFLSESINWVTCERRNSVIYESNISCLYSFPYLKILFQCDTFPNGKLLCEGEIMIHKVQSWQQTPYHLETKSYSRIQTAMIILSRSQKTSKVAEMQSLPGNSRHQKHYKANEKSNQPKSRSAWISIVWEIMVSVHSLIDPGIKPGATSSILLKCSSKNCNYNEIREVRGGNEVREGSSRYLLFQRHH